MRLLIGGLKVKFINILMIEYLIVWIGSVKNRKEVIVCMCNGKFNGYLIDFIESEFVFNFFEI